MSCRGEADMRNPVGLQRGGSGEEAVAPENGQSRRLERQIAEAKAA